MILSETYYSYIDVQKYLNMSARRLYRFDIACATDMH